MLRTLIVGNWKMNGRAGQLEAFDALADGVAALRLDAGCIICPPATLIARAVERFAHRGIAIGAQTCHTEPAGAHTGDISAPMIAELGASHVIVGHSERREAYRESDETVCGQARAAIAAGLVPIICIGETLAERESGKAITVVERQLAGSVPGEGDAAPLIIAYEPIWAIGTGHTPTMREVAEVHAVIRGALGGRFGAAGAGVPILYGGSMKPANAAEILAVEHVNGGLVGGASLKPDEFLAIYRAAG